MSKQPELDLKSKIGIKVTKQEYISLPNRQKRIIPPPVTCGEAEQGGAGRVRKGWGVPGPAASLG